MVEICFWKNAWGIILSLINKSPILKEKDSMTDIGPGNW